MTEANRGHGLKLDEFAIKRKVMWHFNHKIWQHFADKYLADRCHCHLRNVQEHREKVTSPSILSDPPDGVDGMTEAIKKQWKKIVDAGGLPRASSTRTARTG